MGKNNMIRTVVIDAEREARELVKKLLSPYGDFEVTGLGKDGYDAIQLVQACKPDIAILDINLDDIDGVELSFLLKRTSPATSVIILASRLNDGQICKALDNEVAGFLLKDSDLDRLAFILRGIQAGECYMSPRIATRVSRILSRLLRENQTDPPSREQVFPIPSDISKTELQIMKFIGEGRSNKEIAECLRLKDGTVRNYISSAMQKAGLRSRTQLAIYAVRIGLTGIARPMRRI
jgi:DNA-binding NarL/FixJ family response regulator